MKKRGETQEPLHPSRDVGQGPLEYDLPYGGNDGVAITGRGMHGHYFKDEEMLDRSGALTEPAQGRLFDPAKEEGANRARRGRERLAAVDPYSVSVRDTALQESTVPSTDLQPRRTREQETHFSADPADKKSGAAGWYQRGLGNTTRDKIFVDTETRHAPVDTLVHEMGHRKHMGEHEYNSDYVNNAGGGSSPDALQEGVADGYEDRYAGPRGSQVQAMSTDIAAGKGKFGSYQRTGYSTNETLSAMYGWNPTERAVYAAARAHTSETGEMPLYEPRSRHVMERPEFVALPRGNATDDATLHHLLSTSPHAKQALRQTGLKDVGAQAYRRHQDRQLMEQGQYVQGALFDEPHMQHNQFGEIPRSVDDVKKSLGVRAENAAKLKGFT